uniref:Uncharacterized protein n=1 Tax=Panagrolaimus davidi TaxID=227884 RepID=A0A914PAU3_9BILA
MPEKELLKELKDHKQLDLFVISFIHHSARCTAESCSVTVNFKLFAKNFDDPLRAKVLDSFAIGRIVDQNNKSKYSVNGKTAQFKDIQTKLKNAGIDLDHSRFLILQCEVEQISLMKAKAKKETNKNRTKIYTRY